MSFAIVKTHPEMLRYAVNLQRKNSDALGFLPQVVFEKGAEAGQLFLGLLNGEPCGYILVGSGFQGVLRLGQVCIEYDVRRRLYGAMLVTAVEAHGENLGCTRSEVRCASELAANEFWQSMGYRLTGELPSGLSRRYKRSHINVWTKVLFPAVAATEWKNGRPRIHASNAARQAAYRQRSSLLSFGQVS